MLRERLQDVRVVFHMQRGDLAYECENSQTFYRFANLLERCRKVRFKWFQSTRQSLTSSCQCFGLIFFLFSFFIIFLLA